MAHLNGTGPVNQGRCSGRGLGKCLPEAENKDLGKLGKGLGARRKAGGGEGLGRRLKSGNV